MTWVHNTYIQGNPWSCHRSKDTSQALETHGASCFRVSNVFKVVLTALVVATLWLVSSAPVHSLERDPRWRTGGDPRACSSPLWPQPANLSGPGGGKRVLIIGDSLTRESADMLRSSLRKSGWLPTIRCFGGKRLDWAIDQIRAQKAWKGVPQTVIISLGTNDMRWIGRGQTSQRMDRLLNRLGPDRDVMWINTFGGNGDQFSKQKQRWFNDALDRKASKRPNVVVMPWDDIAREGKVKLASALHYTYPGYRLRTQETVRLLNAEFGSSARESAEASSLTPRGPRGYSTR